MTVVQFPGNPRPSYAPAGHECHIIILPLIRIERHETRIDRDRANLRDFFSRSTPRKRRIPIKETPMPNAAMQRKIDDKEAIDLSGFPREGTFYVLSHFVEDKDYCVLETAEWVWSIGRRHRDGVVLASTGSGLYQNPDFECLFLR